MATAHIAKRWCDNWRSDVMGDDRRIVWLLTLQGVEGGCAATKACLSMAAEAGFRVVAMNHSTAIAVSRPAIEAEALRLGMQCILVNDAAHYRLGARLSVAERWSEARALSRDGFDGFILCESGDCRARAEPLLATARALLQDLDQLDWESYQ